MRKIALLLFVVILLLSACQSKDPKAITIEELLSAFEEQELSLKKSNLKDSIFGMVLNGVSPSFYELDGKLLTVYIYQSPSEREKGLEDFRKKTATMNTVSYKVYEVRNVLIFYVYERDLPYELNKKIQMIIENLIQEQLLS
ncbi:hypothetical protein [Ureibacillus manganicus]|uniref:Sporulation protein n=1 Tax=Ureibacillus manganicus DSM 26584 TaxID=1384049 RepID=A0A0A3HQR9_9BACL|nr:hypothetical protein [Ureibacillus manganicus]KGR73575.1 hypothetical protein CD29_19520 [Ureibacillus manganicus DSM 26584]